MNNICESRENLMVRSSRTPTAVQKKLLTKPWPCPTCVSGQSLLPIYQYTLSDARCVKSKRQTLILQKSEIDSVSAYTALPDDNRLASCVTEYNSMYSSVVGRYIRLYSLNSSAFAFNHVSVYSRLGTLISQIGTSTRGPVSSSSGTIIYCNNPAVGPQIETILNSGITSSTRFTAINSTNQDFISNNGAYIQLDLGVNMDIGFIALNHNLDTNRPSMVNKWILILKDMNTATVVTDPVAVFNYQITTSEPSTRVIYTQNFAVSNTYPTVHDPVETFPDSCTNCLTGGKLIRGYKYRKAIDGTEYCFKIKDFNLDPADMIAYESNVDSLMRCDSISPFPVIFIPELLLKVDASDTTNMDITQEGYVRSVNMVNAIGEVQYVFQPCSSASGGIVSPSSMITYVTSPNKAFYNTEFLNKITLKTPDMIPRTNVTYYFVGQRNTAFWDYATLYAVSQSDNKANTVLQLSMRDSTHGGAVAVESGIEWASRIEDTQTSVVVQPYLHVVTFVIQNDYMAIYINGTMISNSPTTARYVSFPTSRTDHNTAFGNNYRMSEFRIYRGKHEPNNVLSIVRQLHRKWGITDWTV